MRAIGADVDAYFEMPRYQLEPLIELAERVDNAVGAVPPKDGYDLASAVSAILNGGTMEDIQAAFTLLQGWNFTPKGGWPEGTTRKEPL